jgi:DNA-binding CsgD family transcriptional regulator
LDNPSLAILQIKNASCLGTLHFCTLTASSCPESSLKAIINPVSKIESGNTVNLAIEQSNDTACIDTISHVTEALGISNWANCAQGRETEVLALTRRFHEQLTNLVRGSQTAPAPVKLTPREVLILKKAAEGKTARETAQDLCRSEHTINKQRSAIMQKMSTRTLAQTVRAAEILGLI